MTSRIREILKKSGKVMAVALLIVGWGTSIGQNVKYEWYQGEQKTVWFQQSDVFAYQTIHGKMISLQHAGDVVSSHISHEGDAGIIHLVIFKDNNSSAKAQILDQIQKHVDFLVSCPVVTMHPDLPHMAAKWFVVGELIAVQFQNNAKRAAWTDEFAQKFSLEVVNDREEKESRDIVLFRPKQKDPVSTIDLAKSVYELENNRVERATPHLLHPHAWIGSTLDRKETHAVPVHENSVGETSQVKHFNIAAQGNRTIKAFVALRQNVKADLKIFDFYGQEINSFPIRAEEKKYEWDISGLTTGTYFSCVVDQEGNTLASQSFKKW